MNKKANFKDWGLTDVQKERIRYFEKKLFKVHNEFSEIFILLRDFKDVIDLLVENEKTLVGSIENYGRNFQNKVDILLFRIDACLKNQQYKNIMKMNEIVENQTTRKRPGFGRGFCKNRITLEEDEKYNEQHNINVN